MSLYNHLEIEKKWQQFWEENKTFSVETLHATSLPQQNQKKFYALDMFPYPSGAGLHVGHPEGYTATDIICRKKRMEGFSVLHPMGWDAFGLPAENFAIKTGVHPNISTQQNIKNFTKQIKSLGFSYDWDREIDSTDPKYYKWTQWLFLKFYEKGLLYEEEKLMNWCPSCKVVCANEEVEQGLHERCGNPVSKKSLKQWMFKITEYAERLLEDLEKPNVIIVHGWGGKGSTGWFAELKNYLEENNIEAFAPDMPNTALPKYEEWKAYFDEHLKKHLKRNTILVGHSLGGGFIQRYLTEENLQVGEIVFVAPTVSSHNISEIANFFDEPFDYEKIKQSADNIFLFAGGKDPYIKKEEFEFLVEKLSAHFSFSPEEEHFWGDRPLDYFPSKAISSFFEKVVASQLDWPEKIKAMQKNWIGKSEGGEISFSIKNSEEKITVYTTRADTIFSGTFLILSPENPLVEQLTTPEQKNEIEKYQKKCAAMSDLDRTELNKEKTGAFTGSYAINPANGDEMPIWISDFVLASYGTGAVFADAHDERDFEMAQKYNIPLKLSIRPEISKYLVIEKSLENAEENLKKFGEIVVEKTIENWGKFFRVSVPFEKEQEFLEFLKENLLPEKISGAESFYADSLGSSNFVVFKDKIFEVFDQKSMEDFKNYGRKIGVVEEQLDISLKCFSDKGILINSGEFDGMKSDEAIPKILDWLAAKGCATKKTNYRLRDWIFTRQRYWGEPIPLVFDENGKCYPLDESELPLVLPESANYEPSESGESPLAKIENWVNVKGYITTKGTVKIIKEGDPHPNPLPEGEGIIQNFRRETSTMPNWAGSSWYWLRFMDARNDEKAWSKESENFWGPVDLYVGGAEHAVLHLLYARFWHKALYDMGLVSTKEPFKKLVNQGLILSYAYQRSGGGLVPMDEVEEKMMDGEPKYFEKSTKEEVKKIVAKMSKSLKNVVNPDEIIEAFGADTLRMYEMFMGPFEQSKAWDTSAVEGMHKFLARIHRNFTEKEIVDVCPPENLVRLTHQTVKKVSDDIDNFKFNTAISQLMIWINEFSKLDHIPRIAGGRFVRLLAPFAPHLAEELWQKFSPEDETISFVKWPSYDEKFLVSDSVVYAVQVNGKLRADFEMPKDATKEEVIAQAKTLEKVQKYLTEGEIKKEVFVPGKIVGFVVG